VYYAIGAGIFGAIDTSTNSIVSTMLIPGIHDSGGNQAYQLVVSPDGATAYITSLWDQDLKVVDLNSMSVTATVPLPFPPFVRPAGFRITPDGSKLYLLGGPHNSDDFHLMVVDTGTLALTEVADPNGDMVPAGLRAMAVASNRLFVSQQLGIPGERCSTSLGNVLIVDTSTDSIVGKIALPNPGTPYDAIGADASGSQVYVGYQVYDDALCHTHTEFGIIDVASPSSALAGFVADPGGDIFFARAAVDPYVPFLTPLRCTSEKRKAAGKAIKAYLACHSRGLGMGVTVDPDCLAKVSGALSAKLDELGSTCPGSTSDTANAIDACVTTLLAHLPGTGRCAGKSAWAQPVNATLSAKTSAGERYPRVSRGR